MAERSSPVAASKPPADGRSLRDFIARRLGLSPHGGGRASDWSQCGNSIGAIALRLGLMSIDEVEQVVDLQGGGENARFGELGRLIGAIDDQQVERLLELQRAHRAIDEVGALLIAEGVDLPQLLRALAEVLEEYGRSS